VLAARHFVGCTHHTLLHHTLLAPHAAASRRQTSRPQRTMKTLCAANMAWISAAMMLLGGVCTLSGILTEAEVTQRGLGKIEVLDYGNHTELSNLWEGRRAARPYLLFGDFLWAFGWLLLITPIHTLALLLGGEQRSGTTALRMCFLAPAMLSIVDFTFQAGTTSVSDRVSESPIFQTSLSAVGALTPLQSLELTYRIARARSMWLSALSDGCVCMGFAAAAFLAHDRRHADFSMGWKVLTIVNMLVAFGGTLSGIVRGADFGELRDLAKPVNGLWFLSLLSLFLPAWLAYLGQQLKDKDGEMGPGNRIDVSRTTVAYPQAMGEASSSEGAEMGAVSHDAV
jgi:hypothetical protein